MHRGTSGTQPDDISPVGYAEELRSLSFNSVAEAVSEVIHTRGLVPHVGPSIFLRKFSFTDASALRAFELDIPSVSRAHDILREVYL